MFQNFKKCFYTGLDHTDITKPFTTFPPNNLPKYYYRHLINYRMNI